MFGFKKKEKTSDKAVESIPTPIEAETEKEAEVEEFDDTILPHDKNIQPPEIKIRISTDNMTAYVLVTTFSVTQKVDPILVIETLKQNNIVYGLHESEIINVCHNKLFHSEFVVATGTPPTEGYNAVIKYNFNTDLSVRLEENEAGVVNFRELNLIQSVKSGDILCELTPAKPGKSGTNVHGDEIISLPGKDLELKHGENTTLSADKLSVTASIDGCVDLKNGIVSVSDLYTVRGDVNSSVGNLNCLGSIVINGDVREGFTVKSKKDIVIKGMIEGAHIIADGNVTISNGMNGMNIGTIVAGGNIVGKYFENSTITSTAGSVYSDVIINSNIHAADSIIVKGGKGSLIGGNSVAGKMVYASLIGARTNVPTTITIESPEFRSVLIPDAEAGKKKGALELERSNLIVERDALQEKITILTPNAVDEVSLAALKQLMAAKSDVAGEIIHIEQQIASLAVDTSSLGSYKVIALKTCFSGVKITMAYLYMNIEDDYSNTKFFISDHKITAGQILPSDKLS